MSVSCSTVRLVPGPQGPPGLDGIDGIDGVNAYTLLSAAFTMPAEGASAAATVLDTSWISPGQLLYLQGAGWLRAGTPTSSTSVPLENVEDTAAGEYLENVAPGTIIALGNKLSPGGLQGPAGDIPAGALLAANDLSDLNDVATARTNLGLGTMAVQPASAVAITGGSIAGITDLAVADGGTGASNASDARTNLGLVIGTDIQAYDALLAAIAALVTVADRMVYTTGVDTVALTALTGFARTLIAANDAASARAVLDIFSGYGLLGSVTGWDLNSGATDTAFLISSSRYRIDRITVDNASTNLTAATGGVFTAAGGAGTTIAADQALSALTAATKFDDLTLEAITGTDVMTAATLYARCGTPQGGAALATLRLWGWDLS